jgi:VWFA-related protein
MKLCRVNFIRAVLFFLFIATAISSVHGQLSQPAASEAVVVAQTVDDICLDLVARGKKGKPVLDLKPEELAVSDNGAKVKVENLRLVTGAQADPHLITFVFDRVSPTGGIVEQVDPYLMGNVRDAMLKILKIVPEKGFAFSVFDIERRLNLLHGFTSDRRELVQAIHAATDPKISGKTSAAKPADQQLLEEVRSGLDPAGKPLSAREILQGKMLIASLNNANRIMQDQHLLPSLAGLWALAQSQEPIVQRKAVIYFTSFRASRMDSRSLAALQSIVAAANRAGVTFYVVDLNSSDQERTQLRNTETVLNYQGQPVEANGSAGITNIASAGLSPGQAPGISGYETQDEIGMMQDRITARTDASRGESTIRRLADETGGSYILGDISRKPMAQLVQDMTTYYEASYHPAIEEYDGSFRPVAIRPLRKGLKVRTQTGYVALPPRAGSGASPHPFELPLMKILSGAQLPNDLSFRSAILPMGPLYGENSNTLVIETPLSNLSLRQDTVTGLYTARASMLAEIKSKSGAVIAHFSEDIPRRGTLKNIDKIQYEAITLQRHFSAPPGQYVLELAVLDRNNNKAGAQRIDFEIPKMAGTLSLSKMVLVREMEPFSAADDPTEPLQHGAKKVTPDLSGQMAPGAKDAPIFLAIHTDPNSHDIAMLNLKVFRNGELLGEKAVPVRQIDGSASSTFLTRIGATPPMDGAYEVKASLSQGGKTSEASTAFKLTGNPTVSVAPASGKTGLAVVEEATEHASRLAITFPTSATERPEPEELKSILAETSQHAVDYGPSLPNFICEQVTDRSVKKGFTWKHEDRLIEQLTYVDHQETRTMLESVKLGVKDRSPKADILGVTSSGEFSSVLAVVFDPTAKADFEWKGTVLIEDGKAQVFDYRVVPANSKFNIQTKTGHSLNIGFHGQVYIDNATRSVRRISMISDGVPKEYRTQGASVAVDYDYILINNHDYLMPVAAQVIVNRGENELDMNEIEFHKFHRFSSNVKILPTTVEAK